MLGKLATDLHRVLVSRILVGKDQQIRIWCGLARKLLAALLRLAAGSAKHCNDWTSGKRALNRREKRSERKLVVRIVNDADHAAVLRLHDLHTARHTQFGEALLDSLDTDADLVRSGDSDQRVFHVKVARDAQQDLLPRLGLVGTQAMQVELDAKADHAYVARPQACLGMLDANGHQALGRRRCLQHTVDLFGAQIHHGGLCLVKDPEFALKIILKRGVFDRRDVVAADVEEARHVKRQILDALVLERLARDLHDHGLATGRAAVGDMAPDLGGLGRSIGALIALDAIVGTHRADHAARLARCLDNRLEHKSGSGLSLGTGDAHDLDVVVGTVVDLRRQQGHGRANAINNQHRSTALLRQRFQRLDQRLFAHKCDGARIERHAQKRGLKGSAFAKEHVTCRDRARIKRAAGHGTLVNLL